MTSTFFSDLERGKALCTSEEITLGVQKAILAKSKSMYPYLAKAFPLYCQDGNGRIVSIDETSFRDMVQAVIPGGQCLFDQSQTTRSFGQPQTPLNSDKYIILDFIEFIYKHLWDSEQDDYHSYCKHYHLTFPGLRECQKEFLDSINTIFERNGIAFVLDSSGQIKRCLPLGLDSIMSHMVVNTEDAEFNNLLTEALKKIRLPKLEERQYAIEKLWDAFERMKTIVCPGDKKKSMACLLKRVSLKNAVFYELLNTEANVLTSIGNNFTIRHFETNKVSLEPTHKDYLFYRMLALISACLPYLVRSQDAPN